MPLSGRHIVSGKSVGPNLSGFGRCTKGHCWQPRPRRAAAGGFSGVEHGARLLREGTVLPRLCTLPWKQSWILNRDACGREPTVCCPFGLPSGCPSPSVVVTALCQVGGRAAGVEGPCGAEGGVEGSKEKTLKLFPGSWEWKNTSAEVVGAKGA